ncbi:hypothetical protein HPB52_018862 [Rhipicephalus sanguineus]|uniref:Uncharacterized protein n=1 Tax=Rhipicephalus sanguineus TaxID=34632 RepID=A0A9D4PJJ3_RHISA|nr:hypothetical protein HPB52_018862 [Rhipicephalus sanguineus]
MEPPLSVVLRFGSRPSSGVAEFFRPSNLRKRKKLVNVNSRRDPAALAVLTTPGRMNRARGCGFPDTGGHEQVWRLEECEALAVPKTGASVHDTRSSLRVGSNSGLFRPSSTSP